MRSTDGEARKEVETKTTHRHCTTWEGMRLEDLGWTTIPKTGPAMCRGIDAYGYPENGVKLKQEPRPRGRPAEPWRGQSTEPVTGRPCHATRSEERDEKQDEPSLECTRP